MVTTPPGVTLRSKWWPVSATRITAPLASTATPRGALRAPGAPTKVPAPPPTSVLTTPPGDTRRRQLLYASATSAEPAASTATPLGPKNEAPAPAPSANAGEPLPASVVTVCALESASAAAPSTARSSAAPARGRRGAARAPPPPPRAAAAPNISRELKTNPAARHAQSSSDRRIKGGMEVLIYVELGVKRRILSGGMLPNAERNVARWLGGQTTACELESST